MSHLEARAVMNVKFKLESTDPLAALGGAVVRFPLTPSSKMVPNGQILLSPNLEDSVDLPAGKYVLVYKIAGQGGEMKVTIATDAATLAQWTISAGTSVGPHSHTFVVA